VLVREAILRDGPVGTWRRWYRIHGGFKLCWWNKLGNVPTRREPHIARVLWERCRRNPKPACVVREQRVGFIAGDESLHEVLAQEVVFAAHVIGTLGVKVHDLVVLVSETVVVEGLQRDPFIACSVFGEVMFFG